MSEALARFIRWVMRDVRYHRMYPSTVQSQSSDGSTVDLLPDDPTIKGDGLQTVPLRHSLPGVVVKVPVGARIMLGFQDGSPGKPYAALWEPGQIESISFGGGTQPIARVGDAAVVYWPVSMEIIGAVAAGVPTGALTGTITIATTASAVIQSGNDKLTA